MNKESNIHLDRLLRLERRPVTVMADSQYAEIGVYSFGRGIFQKAPRSGLEIGNKELFLIKEGDFILQVTFAWEGAVALASASEDGMYGSTRFPTFRVDESLCYPPYLMYYFKTPSGRQQLVKISPGSAGRNRVLSLKRISEVIVPLPSLAEQQRIVARIEELSAQVQEARTLREQASGEAQAILPSVLHSLFINSANWQRMSMEQAIEIKDKQVNPLIPQYSRLPHVSGDNIESGTCQLLPCRTTEEDSVRSSNYLFSRGTILYSKIRPYLRKAVFADFQGLCSADIYPIHVISPELDPQFVKWTLVAEPFTSYANRLSGRTRMPKLNRKQLFGFPLSYPPLSIQHEIVTKLEALHTKVDDLRRLQVETINQLNALSLSILSRAFNGEL